MTQPAGVVEALRHEVHWVDAGRDEPPENGYWKCTCGQTFPPDGVDEYARHLAAAPAHSEPDAAKLLAASRRFVMDVERLARAIDRHIEETCVRDACDGTCADDIAAAYAAETPEPEASEG